MSKRRAIYCCECKADVVARLTTGAEVYPHLPGMRDVPRWICDGCGRHVGTHHRSADFPTRPLGSIPIAEVARARRAIHALIDPPWRRGRIGRRELYGAISAALGIEFHVGEIRTMDEARVAYRMAWAILHERGALVEEDAR